MPSVELCCVGGKVGLSAKAMKLRVCAQVSEENQWHQDDDRKFERLQALSR
jgi:hypothetical protein